MRPATVSAPVSAPVPPKSAAISSSPVVSRLPAASAVEKTTPMTVSVARRVRRSIAPHEQRAEQQHREAADHGVDVQDDREADPRQRDVRERVRGERHPAHDREAADEAGGDAGADREGGAARLGA